MTAPARPGTPLVHPPAPGLAPAPGPGPATCIAIGRSYYANSSDAPTAAYARTTPCSSDRVLRVTHRSHDARDGSRSRAPGSRFGPGSKPLRRVTRRRWFRNKPNRGARGSGTQAPHRPLSKSLFLTIQSFTFHSSGSPSLRDRVAGVPTASGSVWSCRCGLQALMLQAMVCAASSSSARCSLQESNGTIAAQRGINVGEAQLVGTAHRRDLGLGL